MTTTLWTSWKRQQITSVREQVLIRLQVIPGLFEQNQDHKSKTVPQHCHEREYIHMLLHTAQWCICYCSLVTPCCVSNACCQHQMWSVLQIHVDELDLTLIIIKVASVILTATTCEIRWTRNFGFGGAYDEALLLACLYFSSILIYLIICLQLQLSATFLFLRCKFKKS